MSGNIVCLVGRSPTVLFTMKALWNIFGLNKHDLHSVVVFIDDTLIEVLAKTQSNFSLKRKILIK